MAGMSCRSGVDFALEKNAKLRRLLLDLEKHGCPISRSFYSCGNCSQQSTGYYNLSEGVVLCENNLVDQKQLEETLIHETLHAYDYCRAQMDLDNCLHVACSEIRAVNLSGECNPTSEWKRDTQNWKFIGHKPECVRRRAELAMSTPPTAPCAKNAAAHIERAWKACANDTAPFDRA